MAHPVSGPNALSVEVTELMYADFFGLRELPFNNTPDPRFFYSTPDHEEALASLIYAVKQRKGFVLVTGEVGAGKTLVSRLMLRQFGSSVVFANINHAVRTAGDLMESLCTEFELPVEKGASETQMVRTLHDFLLTRFAENTPVVLVLDEAQNLPVSAFEQLRMIGNLEADDAKLLQIAILGQPELQQMFQSAELRQLKQRLFSSYHLPALDRNATDGYIRYRLSVAGARQTNLFRSAAVDRIFDASRGLPRLINTLCDNAMLAAYSAGKRSIDEEIVEGIIAQLDSQHTSESRTRTASAQAPPPMWPAPYGYGHPMYPPVAAYAPPPWAYQMPQTYGMPYVQQPQHAATMRQAPATPQTDERPAELPKAESIRERIEQAKKRAARLELRYSGGAAVARDARNAQTGLQSATRHAENVLARIETSAKSLTKREKNLAALSTSVRDVAGELMDLLKDVRSASTESRRERQKAQDLHENLQRIASRTNAGIEERAVASSSPITTRPNAMANSQPSAQLLKQATALIGENKLASKLADVRNLAQVLGETKKSSEALRKLANAPRERDAAARLEDEVANLARVSETDAG